MREDPEVQRLSPALADLFIPERTEEIAFWSELAQEYGRVVVEWHCGTGELASGLAKNHLRVVGVDPDADSIELARTRDPSQADSLWLTWVCHEPRLVALPGAADFSILSGNTLGQYVIEEQRIGLITNLFNHLRPGGALGMVVPMAPVSGIMHNKYISGPLRRLPKGIFARRVSTLRYDAEQALLSGQDEVLVRLPGGEQRFQESYLRRLYTPDEIFGLLRQVGFTAIGMWGGWDRRPLREATGAFIVRAERPSARAVGKKSGE